MEKAYDERLITDFINVEYYSVIWISIREDKSAKIVNFTIGRTFKTRIYACYQLEDLKRSSSWQHGEIFVLESYDIHSILEDEEQTTS